MLDSPPGTPPPLAAGDDEFLFDDWGDDDDLLDPDEVGVARAAALLFAAALEGFEALRELLERGPGGVRVSGAAHHPEGEAALGAIEQAAAAAGAALDEVACAIASPVEVEVIRTEAAKAGGQLETALGAVRVLRDLAVGDGGSGSQGADGELEMRVAAALGSIRAAVVDLDIASNALVP